MMKLSDKFKERAVIAVMAVMGAYGVAIWKDIYNDYHMERTERAKYTPDDFSHIDIEPLSEEYLEKVFKPMNQEEYEKKIKWLETVTDLDIELKPATDEELEELAKPVIIDEKYCTKNRGDLSEKLICPSKP